MTDCEHGLPPGCPLHRQLGRRVLHCAVIAALAALDVAVVALVLAWGYGLLHGAAAVMWGQR